MAFFLALCPFFASAEDSPAEDAPKKEEAPAAQVADSVEKSEEKKVPPKPRETLIVATTADYPPFSFVKNKDIVGFEVDLAGLVAEELDMDVRVLDFPFISILGAVRIGKANVAMAAFEYTEERSKRFDFSQSYYGAGIAVLYPKENPVPKKEDLYRKRIGCQTGSVMETYCRKELEEATIMTFDNVNTMVQYLKTGRIIGAYMDVHQAREFAQKDSTLTCQLIQKSEGGYKILMKKDSPLKESIDQALTKLKEMGKIQELEKKWGLEEAS
jgi:polar amino acid transport system substrate-binding protein